MERLGIITIGQAPRTVLDAASYQHAADELKNEVDMILLDCMGYTEQARDIVSSATGLPVVLSNALVAKLVSEMI